MVADFFLSLNLYDNP
ncbi:Protein of unknown function [Pyronema omphalodes CBS 100304]|uniref:Uncharacterized protein n=1 Tax=Pyronema omphalodes (strain CBS 100304) TaxID=1076935 RepID=U4L4C4_PYROM|nr:Protein of unknown function [Pyronema omphalodes CBS 100304]